MLKRGERVLLCVSGGPDSVALLFLFIELKKEFGLNLYIAHLNHMLRGKESDEDEEYVRELAQQLKLPISSRRIDVEAKAKAIRRSVEETARIARYDFFLEAATKEKLDKVAVAHTQDDQAETLLMRLIRGSGLGGLASIAPKRTMGEKWVIRPLIEISREEIEDYLKEKKVVARHDSTNLKPLYFRNKVRLELIPLLEKEYNKNIKEILANTAELLRGDYEFISQILQEAFKDVVRNISPRKGDTFCPQGGHRLPPQGGHLLPAGKKKEHPGSEPERFAAGIAISLKRLSRYAPALRRRVLRRAIEEVKGDLRRIELRHLKDLEDFLASAKDGGCMDLPSGIEVLKERDVLRIWLGEKPQ